MKRNIRILNFINVLSLGSFLLIVLMNGFALQAAWSDETFSLSNEWYFRTDPGNEGMGEKWFKPTINRSAWSKVIVPHTWQTKLGLEDYYGVAWYAKKIAPIPSWQGKRIELEFDAVYRDAQVWVNGIKVGEHIGSGWTPFSIDLANVWRLNQPNVIVLRVDNRFSENAIPYKNSFDWASDGGIIRNVRLRITPPVYIKDIFVNAEPREDLGGAFWQADIKLRHADERSWVARIYEPGGRQLVIKKGQIEDPNDEEQIVELSGVIKDPKLWHFDYPHLYRFHFQLIDDQGVIHQKETTFGIRKVEMKDGLIYLNGEPMRLMGVEWMPGSDPNQGMAEDRALMREVLTDMKRLNCILTRFHWQQDDFVFDFCDREGMLVQEEIPAWGGRTIQGDLETIQAQQTQEMIHAHYNHPSIYAWGVCNEIGGQRQDAFEFVRNGVELARSLDPTRLLTYASNTLQNTPEKDASQFVDFIEWNDYYESWFGGSLEDLSANLERIHEAYPDKSLIISEYGLCECSPKNPSGDERRIEILKTHTDIYRESGVVAGAIFFNYNDYRTHIGDKGQGSFQQRVHGVVDLQRNRKPSWEALRRESSPIRTLIVHEPEQVGDNIYADVEINTRSLVNDLPAYTLRGYQLIWTAYNQLDQPIGTGKTILPDLEPGSQHIEPINWPAFDGLVRVRAEVFRPTGYSVLDVQWQK